MARGVCRCGVGGGMILLVVDADITGYLPAGRNGKVSVSIVYNYWASNPRKYYILDDETGEYARWQSPDRFAADMILND